jgi:hypothetical protein
MDVTLTKAAPWLDVEKQFPGSKVTYAFAPSAA